MYLYGAGGHGKVIREIVEASGGQVEAFIDDNADLAESAGLQVLHNADGAEDVIVSIGSNAGRKSVVEKLGKRKYCTAIHPRAIISPTAEIGEGTVVMPGAVINAYAKIGKHCIINTGATVDHECEIGDFAHIAPGVHLCGLIKVGEGALMGVGSCAIPCVEVGPWKVVGAGVALSEDCL